MVAYFMQPSMQFPTFRHEQAMPAHYIIYNKGAAAMLFPSSCPR